MPDDDKKALRRKYDRLFQAVEAILLRYDPIGIKFEGNTHQYDPEVSTILPRAWRAISQDEVRQIVREEFERWLGQRSRYPLSSTRG
jgi:hypothetical protein